jgi:hypothetical protein
MRKIGLIYLRRWVQTVSRKLYRAERYKSKFGAYCFNPKCQSPCDGIECHHIIPLKFGGEDEESNMIQLCFTCHRRLGLHREEEYENHIQELFAWKFRAEGPIRFEVATNEGPANVSNELEEATWEETPKNRKILDKRKKPLNYKMPFYQRKTWNVRVRRLIRDVTRSIRSN